MKQQYVLITANVLLIHIGNGRYMICCNIDMMNLFNHFFIDSHCSLYFTFHHLGKCYNKNLHTNILCYSSLCSLAVVTNTLKISPAYQNKSLFLAHITVWCKSGCYYEFASNRDSGAPSYGFPISDLFVSSSQHGRELGRQGKVYDKDWMYVRTLLPRFHWLQPNHEVPT